MIESLIIFAVIIVVLVISSVFIILEFKKIRSKQDTSNVNDVNLDANMKTTAVRLNNLRMAADSNLQSSINQTSSSLQSRLNQTQSTLQTGINQTQTSLDNSTKMLDNKINATNTVIAEAADLALTAGIAFGKYVVDLDRTLHRVVGSEDDLNVTKIKFKNLEKPGLFDDAAEIVGQSNASMIYDTNDGIKVTGNSKKSDLWAPRATVGQTLNVAGTLNFANTNGAYTLGVDTTSLYLNIPANKSLSVKGDVQIEHDVQVNNNICIQDVCIDKAMLSKVKNMS